MIRSPNNSSLPFSPAAVLALWGLVAFNPINSQLVLAVELKPLDSMSVEFESPEPTLVDQGNPPLPWSDKETAKPIEPIEESKGKIGTPKTVSKTPRNATSKSKLGINSSKANKLTASQQETNESVGEAFQLGNKALEKTAKLDIAAKLAKATHDRTNEKSAGTLRIYLSTRQTENLTVGQLERIATEANTIHSLTRLITRCQKTLTADLAGTNLSEQDRQKVNQITGWAYTRRGQARHSEAQIEEAINDFTVALVFDPYQTNAYLNRGTLFANFSTKQAKQKALVDFDQVIRLEPDHLIALRNRATLYLELNKPAQSLLDSKRGIKLWSQEEVRSRDLIVSLYELAGNASLQLRMQSDALEFYDLALHYDSDSTIVRLRRGALYASASEYELAIDDLLAAITSPNATDNESSEAYRCLSWLLATCPEERYRDPLKAIEAANRAIRLSQAKSPKLFETLAVAYASADDFSKAIEWQKKVVHATNSRVERQAANALLKQFRQGTLLGLNRVTRSENLRQATFDKATVNK